MANICTKFLPIALIVIIVGTYKNQTFAQEAIDYNQEKIDPNIDRFNKRVDILEIEEDENKAAIRKMLEELQETEEENPKKVDYTDPIELNIAKTRLIIGGFVQSDFIYDFNVPNLGASFIPSAIPIYSKADPKLTFSYLQSRFTLQSQTQTSLGLLKTLFEYDLFSDGINPGFHVRHAWGELGNFGAGQYWSVFMDIDIFPNILDYQGPNAMVFVRQPQLRYTNAINNNLKIAISVEKPNSDVFQNVNKNLLPDVAMHFNYRDSTSGHIQLAAVVHPVKYENKNIKLSSEFGWGLNLTGSYNIASSLNNTLMFQAAYGKGISRYFNDISGLGYDGVVNNLSADKEISLLNVGSIMAFYNHNWSSKFSSAVGWGYLKIENIKLQLEDAFKSSHYGVANVIYYPIAPIKVGLEYLYGMKINKKKDTGINNRLQLSIMYKF